MGVLQMKRYENMSESEKLQARLEAEQAEILFDAFIWLWEVTRLFLRRWLNNARS